MGINYFIKYMITCIFIYIIYIKLYNISILIYIINRIIIYIVIVLRILISIAFLTLLERKLLGGIHLRKGPNKNFLIGIFQPFNDVIKLFLKENIKLIKFNYFIYLISPIFGLLLLIIC